MRFQTELVPATLIRRYKRFLADILLPDGQEVVAHCPNPGSMMGLKDEGTRVWVEPNDDPKKKLKFGWRLVELGDAFVCIDTSRANAVVAQALRDKKIPQLAMYDTVRPEQKYGENSRIDFLLQGDGLPDAYVEVKSVTLMRQTGLAEFPDSVTARGTKHLAELAKVAGNGARAIQLYLVARTDCSKMGLAADIDPTYARACSAAMDANVEFLCFDTAISPQGITLRDPLPIDISPDAP